MTTFNGFPQQTVTFLLDLRHNNNREWFKTHKSEFDEYVTSPARLFSDAMIDALSKSLSEMGEDEPVKSSIFRIYRDIRFSKDKTPYKTHLSIWFWQGARPRMENSGFYFHLEPPKLMLAAGIHTFPKPVLKAYRNAVINEWSGSQLIKALHAVQSKGDFDIGQKRYKRIPRGFAKDHPRADFLLFSGLTASEEDLIPEVLYTNELVDYCLKSFEWMYPLHCWLQTLLEESENLENAS